MKLLDTLLSLSIPSLIILHLLVAPYTKVEESFNIQAAHDVLVYGTPTSNVYEKLRANYDHFTFPGAVPRTFIGPVLLAGVSQSIVATTGFQHAQLVVRAVLGLFNAAALLFFASNVRRALGASTARWYVLLQASQFHVIFYASRTLPNMFAFGLTTFAFACLLPHPDPKAVAPRIRLAVSLFVFAAVIFRAELALLLATTGIYLLLIPLASLQGLVPPVLVSALAALLISVPLDSYFWQRPLWPELWGFYFNAVLGSSSEWGVSPWHYYFTSALPRILSNPLVPLLLIPVAVTRPATIKPARLLILPSLAFVAIYSLQGHKEARFIFYVAPPLTAAAALGANFVSRRRGKSALYAVGSLALLASVVLSFATSVVMLLLSSLNYPGGEALAQLRDLARQDAAESRGSGVVAVHADVLACMTGVTLFETAAMSSGMPSARDNRSGKISKSSGVPALALDKTEDKMTLRDPKFWRQFDYILVEDPATVRGGKWDVVGVVQGYAGIEILRPGQGESSGGRDGDTSEKGERVLGRGALVAAVRDLVRRRSGGWWVGPRMEPRLRIMRRVRTPRTEDAAGRSVVH